MRHDGMMRTMHKTLRLHLLRVACDIAVSCIDSIYDVVYRKYRSGPVCTARDCSNSCCRTDSFAIARMNNLSHAVELGLA